MPFKKAVKGRVKQAGVSHFSSHKTFNHSFRIWTRGFQDRFRMKPSSLFMLSGLNSISGLLTACPVHHIAPSLLLVSLSLPASCWMPDSTYPFLHRVHQKHLTVFEMK
jgi:hypothetical protein